MARNLGDRHLFIEVSWRALPLASERSHLRDYHHPNPVPRAPGAVDPPASHPNLLPGILQTRPPPPETLPAALDLWPL